MSITTICSRACSSPRKDPHTLDPHPSRSSFRKAHGNQHLPSVSMDLPALDVSCKWTHTLCGFLWLASLTECVPKFIHVAGEEVLMLYELLVCGLWVRYVGDSSLVLTISWMLLTTATSHPTHWTFGSPTEVVPAVCLGGMHGMYQHEYVSPNDSLVSSKTVAPLSNNKRALESTGNSRQWGLPGFWCWWLQLWFSCIFSAPPSPSAQIPGWPHLLPLKIPGRSWSPVG